MASSDQLPDFRAHGGDRKLRPLTRDNLRADAYAEKCVRFLEALTGDSLSKMTVLDVGCGRGDLVARLRSRGVRAFGIDIDQRFIDSGQILLELFPDEFDVLSVPDSNQKSVFPDGYFDLVVSFQVLEHVEDLDEFVREIARLVRPQGLTAHVFPAKHRLREAHYEMPFVHWLPKNGLRKAAITLCLALGFGSRFFPRLNIAERASIIYKYSNQKTFYRGAHRILSSFQSHRFSPVPKCGVDALIAARAPRLRSVRNLVRPIITSFWTTVIVARAA